MEEEINEILEKYYDYASVPATEKLVALIIRVTDSIIGEWETETGGQTEAGVTAHERNDLRMEQRIRRDELLK
jgi:hypothetical protein